MHPIIYDVAVSLDGFISGVAGDVSKFAHDGPVVEDYATRLGTYKSAIMGRATYEFGYEFGLQPGQNPYPHMQTTIFSDTLRVPDGTGVTVRKRPTKDAIRQLALDAAGPIYLCGGGNFAGWMLENGLIDRLILKRAPCVLGAGTRLFGNVSNPVSMTRLSAKRYENGYSLEEFALL